MEKFTLYLGLNDKDTKTQKIGTIEGQRHKDTKNRNYWGL